MKLRRPSRLFAITVPISLLLALTVGCAGPLAPTNAPPTPSPTVQPTATQVPTASPVPTPVLTPTPSPTVAPSPTGNTSAPAELQGQWETTLANGDHVSLTLSAVAFHINREGRLGSGRISVIGDEITFSNSPPCSELGTYTWSLVDDTLDFATVQDGCPARREVIGPATFTKP